MQGEMYQLINASNTTHTEHSTLRVSLISIMYTFGSYTHVICCSNYCNYIFDSCSRLKYLEQKTLTTKVNTKNILEKICHIRLLYLTFKFWENLVLCYLKSLNGHDLIFTKAVHSWARELSLEEFTQRKILYLSLTLVFKREQIRFFERRHRRYFETYSERECEYDQPYTHLRFCCPTYKLVYDRIKFYQFNDPQGCLETQAPIGESDCVFHEPKRFWRHHGNAKTLTLDCCRGITSQHLLVYVRVVKRLDIRRCKPHGCWWQADAWEGIKCADSNLS